MKKRLFAALLAVALLFVVVQPVLPVVPFGVAAPVIIPDADCQGGGQCTN